MTNSYAEEGAYLGALVGLVAGQIPPLTFLAEEAVSIPALAILGMLIGSQFKRR